MIHEPADFGDARGEGEMFAAQRAAECSVTKTESPTFAPERRTSFDFFDFTE